MAQEAVSDAALFGELRQLKRRWTRKPTAALTQAEVDEINLALGRISKPISTGATEVIGGKKGPLAAILGTVAATSLFATIPQEEGVEYKAYRDIAGIWTVCAGDTSGVHAGLIETPEGCRQRLEKQLVAHAGPVMACTPRLSEPGRDYQRAAAVSLAYNIGVANWCHSTADWNFDQGNWRGGCDAFLRWNKARVGGQLRTVQGLANRRARERAICLRGVA
jgi:lysozyme